MTIKVTGKNVDLGESLRDFALGRVEQAVDKYFARPATGQLFIEKAHGQFLTSCSLHLHSGHDVQTSGRANDAYASVEDAAEKLEKQLRRYKRRLKDHNQAAAALRKTGDWAKNYVIETREDPAREGEDEAEDGLAPPIIAEEQTALMTLSVGDAVMRMDLTDAPMLIFRNASHGGVNVVYRRPDGNIGWIDPGGAGAEADKR
jgi:ribosomal subunit interface protein